MEKNIVIGASGGLGLAVIRELLISGERVVAISRNPDKVMEILKKEIPRENLIYLDVFAQDATQLDELRKLCTGATVIYQCANPPYKEMERNLPLITDNLIQITKENRAKLVWADCTFIYGEERQNPIHEDHQLDLRTQYAKTKVEMTEKVMAAHNAGEIKATCGRFSKIYGPNVENDFISPVFVNAINDKKSEWLGDLDKNQSLTFVYNIAESLVLLGDSDSSYGEVWHLPCGEPITGREFISTIFEELNKPVKIGVLNQGKSRIFSRFRSSIRESSEMLLEFEQDTIIDYSKFLQHFDPIPINSHDDAIKQTLSWYQNGYTMDPFEDDLFSE